MRRWLTVNRCKRQDRRAGLVLWGFVLSLWRWQFFSGALTGQHALLVAGGGRATGCGGGRGRGGVGLGSRWDHNKVWTITLDGVETCPRDVRPSQGALILSFLIHVSITFFFNRGSHHLSNNKLPTTPGCRDECILVGGDLVIVFAWKVFLGVLRCLRFGCLFLFCYGGRCHCCDCDRDRDM